MAHPASCSPAIGSGAMAAAWGSPLWPWHAGQHRPRGLLTAGVWRSSSAALQTQTAGGGGQPSKAFDRHELSEHPGHGATPRQGHRPARLCRHTDRIPADGVRNPWAAAGVEGGPAQLCRHNQQVMATAEAALEGLSGSFGKSSMKGRCTSTKGIQCSSASAIGHQQASRGSHPADPQMVGNYRRQPLKEQEKASTGDSESD